MTKARVLITEDELVVALDLERRLTKLGYEICAVVSTGERAVEKVGLLRPDLVLMDICLPGELDGIQAAAKIREAYAIPVIYLTANADDTTLRRAAATHPGSYLLKPFRERELQICIDLALQNNQLQRQLSDLNTSLETRVDQRTQELLAANEALNAEVRARTQAEQLARDQAALLDKASDAISVRTLEGKIVYLNRSAETLHGLQSAAAIGQLAEELLHELPNNPDEDPAEIVLARGEWSGEMTARGGNGQEILLASRWTLVRDADGNPRSILVVNTDISERRRTEDQRARVDRMECVGALANGIAHDLNNVFTPMIMSAQMLEEESSEDARSSAQIIRTSAERGAALVKQILHLVKGSHGAARPFRLEHLVKDVLRLLRENIGGPIDFQLKLAPEVWPVRGDSARIHEAVTSLCIHARQTLPAGGRLSVQLENFILSPETAHLEPQLAPGNYVRLGLTALAPKASKAEQPIAARAERKSPDQAAEILSLANARHILQDHGGCLSVRSMPQDYSVFEVYLPAGDAEKIETPASAAPFERGNGERILLVEDENAVRQIVATTLRAHGYEVLTATDGLGGLTVLTARSERIDVLLTDIAMPNLDGLSLARAAVRIDRNLPVILASGTLPGLSIHEVENQGFLFLMKPFSTHQLLATLGQALAGAKRV